MPETVPGAAILLLEDDTAIASTIAFTLEREGYVVQHCPLVRDARRSLAAGLPDLAILDVGLPDGSGLDLCRDLRADTATQRLPVLMLSARSEEIDRVLGLELGADDYVPKPFSPRELLARVRALLRRSQPPAAAPAPVAAASPWRVDTDSQRIWLGAQALPLTRLEYGLLRTLMTRPGRIYSRDALLDAVWGGQAESTDRTVDTHIKTLRAKLRAAGADPECIQTHRGMGYSLTVRP